MSGIKMKTFRIAYQYVVGLTDEDTIITTNDLKVLDGIENMLNDKEEPMSDQDRGTCAALELMATMGMLVMIDGITKPRSGGQRKFMLGSNKFPLQFFEDLYRYKSRGQQDFYRSGDWWRDREARIHDKTDAMNKVTSEVRLPNNAPPYPVIVDVSEAEPERLYTAAEVEKILADRDEERG